MSDLRRVARLVSAALVVALAAFLSPGMATAAGTDLQYVAQETTPEGVVLPDEEGEAAQGEGEGEQDAQQEDPPEEPAPEEEPADEGAQDDEADTSDREQSAGGSGGTGGMPNTGPETLPLTLLGLTLLASGLVLRHRTRRRRRMRW